MERKENYDADKKNMLPLEEGDIVQVQNMTGAKPNRWDKTGMVVEKMGNRQYHVKMDGSRRVLLRNRKNLKKITPLEAEDTTPRFLREVKVRRTEDARAEETDRPAYPQNELGERNDRVETPPRVVTPVRTPRSVTVEPGASPPCSNRRASPTSDRSTPAGRVESPRDQDRASTPRNAVSREPTRRAIDFENVNVDRENIVNVVETGRPRREVKRPGHLQDYVVEFNRVEADQEGFHTGGDVDVVLPNVWLGREVALTSATTRRLSFM